MDDRRFDSLARSLASGASRRSVLKGLLGLGGAALTGSVLLDGDSEAARRPPNPTPTPVKCPGKQTLSGGQCVCLSPPAPGTAKCGPDCCNPSGVGAAHSECCDNACCYGKCYGEELCCPTGRTFCEATGECCPVDQPYCCGAAGCCATPCCSTTAGPACCEGDTPKCCPEDICIAAGGCCNDRECGEGTCFSCDDHVCRDDQEKCAGCLECRNGACVQVNGNCSDGQACTRDICNADGSCSNPFDCALGTGCCDDGNACTRSTCTGNGTCTPQVFDCRLSAGCCTPSNPCFRGICNQDTGECSEVPDCRLPNCVCVPDDVCHVATCHQDTGGCTQVEECSAACCEAVNPDEGCLSNGRCSIGDTDENVVKIGICYYDLFCATPCCATFIADDSYCATEGPFAGSCVVPF